MKRLFHLITVTLLLLSGAVWLADRPYFRISTVEITNEEGADTFEYADKQQVYRAMLPHLTGSFFRINVRNAKRAAEGTDWVASAKISRIPPATVKVVLRENKPTARWIRENETAGLINQHGGVFQAAFDGDLPSFDGELSALPLMLEKYKTLSTHLQPLRLKIIRLQYSPRLSWTMTLDNGIEVRLGKEDIHKRIALFARMWPISLAVNEEKLDYVDMRYPDGFATSNRTDAPDTGRPNE